jgi:hypothetical protein
LKFKVAHAQDMLRAGVVGGRGPPADGLHPRNELARGVGFGQVVVRAFAQALHAGLQLVAGRDDQHGHIAFLAQFPQHGETVHDR